MSTRIFLLLSIVAAFLQGSLFPPVLFEGLLAVSLVATRGKERVFAGLFAGGLIFDLVQSQSLGVTSLIFLVGGFGILALRREIGQRAPLVAGAVIILTLARGQLVFSDLFLVPAAVGGIVTFVLFAFVLHALPAAQIKLR